MNIGRTYRDLGETEKAIHWFRMTLEIDPDFVPARKQIPALEERLKQRQQQSH